LLDADAYHPSCDSMGFGSLSESWTARHQRRPGIRPRRQCLDCNDKDEMRQLINAGVSGIISDFPNRVRDVLTSNQTIFAAISTTGDVLLQARQNKLNQSKRSGSQPRLTQSRKHQAGVVSVL